MEEIGWKNTLGWLALLALLVLAREFRWFTPSNLRRARRALGAVPWPLVIGGALFLAALGGAAVLAYRWKQRLDERARAEAIVRAVAQGPTVLLLPRADAARVDLSKVQVWARLADALPHDEHMAFEVAGNGDQIAFTLHGSENGVRAALTQFRAEWPGMHRKAAADDPAAPPEGWSIHWVELAPARFDEPVAAVTDEPLRAVFIELNGVMGQGRGMVQLIARRNFGARKQLGEMAFAARDDASPSKGVRAIRAQEARRFEERARKTYLDVTLRAVGMADTPERAQGIARGLARALAASFDGRNPVQPVREGDDPQVVLARVPGQTMPWAADDLAAIGHLPGRDLLALAPRLRTAPARHLPAAPEMRFSPHGYRTAFLEERHGDG